jgi:L-iditol 2-dehydrogenase
MKEGCMKVLRLHGEGDLRLHDEPDPVPSPGESLVRVTAVGLCGSDMHWLHEAGMGDARLDKPLILGHEFAGVIEGGSRDGERVAVDPAISCGECEFCREGNPNFCIALRFAGHGTEDGALREKVVWPTRFLYPLPDSLSSADGAMLEPLGVAIHAVDLGHLRTGMTIGVFGCGPIGLLTIQVARVAGAAQIIATDRLPHRLEAARSLGADTVFQASDGGYERSEVLAATGGGGVDVAFEAAGENSAVETAVEVARRGARVVLIGIPGDDRTAFTASTARRSGLTIKLVRRMKHTFPRAIHLVTSGAVDVRSLLTYFFPLNQAEEAFTTAKRRVGIKVIIEP